MYEDPDPETVAAIIESLNESYAKFLRDAGRTTPADHEKLAFRCGWLLGVKYGILEGYRAGAGEEL